jgi:hypothetical protein
MRKITKVIPLLIQKQKQGKMTICRGGNDGQKLGSVTQKKKKMMMMILQQEAVLKKTTIREF